MGRPAIVTGRPPVRAGGSTPIHRGCWAPGVCPAGAGGDAPARTRDVEQLQRDLREELAVDDL